MRGDHQPQPPHPQDWQVGRARRLALDRPQLMGILNVTPDSFFDGGRYPNVESAVETGLRMITEGAAIIDVGGESSRPSAAPVEEPEQIRRTTPVIAALRRRAGDEIIISIDTTRAAVARAALDAGADVINDISAGRDDEAMFALAAERGCGLVLMHRLTQPVRDSYSDRYPQEPDYGGDVVSAVRRFLIERCEAAHAAGVSPASIVADPGLGFGKSVPQNFELVARIIEAVPEGVPALSAASRKSFVGAARGGAAPTAPAERLAGSLAITLLHARMGVGLFRVHDVGAHRQALAVIEAVQAASAAFNAAAS